MKAVKDYLASLADREFVLTGVRTALFVGSLLFLINHGPAVVQGKMTRDRWASGALTYLMPYLVSVYGQYAYRCKSAQLLAAVAPLAAETGNGDVVMR